MLYQPEPNLGMNNFDKDAGVFLVGKRRATTQHFVDENSESPEVNALQPTQHHHVIYVKHLPRPSAVPTTRAHSLAY